MHTAEGPHDYPAGEAFYWGPGHAPEALEDSEYVDFSPTEDFHRVVDHLKREGPRHDQDRRPARAARGVATVAE